jgi:hypothetical protein
MLYLSPRPGIGDSKALRRDVRRIAFWLKDSQALTKIFASRKQLVALSLAKVGSGRIVDLAALIRAQS